MKKSSKIIICALCSAILITSSAVCLYLYAIPQIVKSNWTNTLITKEVKKTFGADLIIKNPELTTSISPNIGFKLDEIVLSKDKKRIFYLNNLDIEISLKDFFEKQIIVKKILINDIFANVSDIIKLLPQQDNTAKQEMPFKIDFYSTIFETNKCLFVYNSPDFNAQFDAKKIILDRTTQKKYLHFDFDFKLNKGNDKILISADDKRRIYMGNGELHIDSFPIEIDNSKIIINAFASRKSGMNLDIAASKFKSRDIYNLLASNIIIPNGKELLAPVVDVNGNLDFDLHLKKNNIKGNINVNESEFKIKDLLNMPVKITQGKIEIGNKDISLKDFKGFYNNKKENNFVMSGEIKDYWKTCNTKIVSDIFINDDFFKNYLTKMLNAPIDLIGDAGSRLTLTSKNGSCDLVWYFLLRENEGFKLGEQSMVLKDYKTLFKVDLSVIKNILKINSIDYFITNELKKGMTPVLSLNGDIDMADNMKLLNLNMNIPRPLPSEFLNFLCGQKIFKKGTISGDLSIDNSKAFPTMDGVITLDKVFVPAQRLYIKSAKIGAKDDKLGAVATGKFKRSNYDFNGYIVNDLRLPIVVKSVNLKVDDIDLERMLNSYNTSDTNQKSVQQALEENQAIENDDIPTFTKGLVIVEKCLLHLDKGKYKNINFGNLQANLTLDKDGILEIQSNKFDIAEGISTLKVKADLIKNLYYLRLGIKDVNSTIMADSLLGLPKEISGKAMGLIEINSDANLKLNGDIKFNIQNGTIEKIGYVEYILKVASIFRNPIVMITPTTFGDLVNIPNGQFDTIKGELKLKDNVITKMMIKSSAKHLSSFIIGRYNLETNDTSLRIYTKMTNKGEGFAGFLRNLSLNSLANKISASGRNDRNYYASELEQLPKIESDDKDSQVFLTTVEGDVINFNFLSSLKRIK